MNLRRRYWNGLAANQLLRVMSPGLFLALTRRVPLLAFGFGLLLAAVLGLAPPWAALLLWGIGLTTDAQLNGTSTAMALTWTALGNSATAGRQSTVVDLTGLGTFPIDVLFTVTFSTNASAPTGDKACYVYVAGSEDGTNFDHDDAALGATDAGYTINNPSNLKGPGVINAPTASKVYVRTFTLSSFFGGVLPRKWAIVLINQTGNALLATTTNTQPTYTPINDTNA